MRLSRRSSGEFGSRPVARRLRTRSCSGLWYSGPLLGDPRRARVRALRLLPATTTSTRRCPTSFRAAVAAHRHARRGHPDPRAVSDADGAVRHRRRRSDRRVRRAGAVAVLRHDVVERRPGADRAAASCSWRAAALPAGAWLQSSAPCRTATRSTCIRWCSPPGSACSPPRSNLLPFGQLDGGHIAYATLGDRSTPISLATVAGAVAMAFVSTSWVLMAVMMIVDARASSARAIRA